MVYSCIFLALSLLFTTYRLLSNQRARCNARDEEVKIMNKTGEIIEHCSDCYWFGATDGDWGPHEYCRHKDNTWENRFPEPPDLTSSVYVRPKERAGIDGGSLQCKEYRTGPTCPEFEYVGEQWGRFKRSVRFFR